MKRADLTAGCVLALVSVMLVYQTSQLPIFDRGRVGSGFLPFWLSLALLLLSILLIVSSLLRPAASDEPVSWPSGPGLRRIALTSGALAGYFSAITVLGYLLSTFAFLVVLMRITGSYRWPQTLGLSLLTTLALFVLFRTWLGVSLPQGLLAFL